MIELHRFNPKPSEFCFFLRLSGCQRGVEKGTELLLRSPRFPFKQGNPPTQGYNILKLKHTRVNTHTHVCMHAGGGEGVSWKCWQLQVQPPRIRKCRQICGLIHEFDPASLNKASLLRPWFTCQRKWWEKTRASALMTAGPFVDGGHASFHILAAIRENLCPGRAFFLTVSSQKCFAVFKKGKIVNKASSFNIFAWLVLTPAGAAEQGLQQLGNQCPTVSQEAELMGAWAIPPLQSWSYNHEGNKRAQLTWLMCLSLSMIWLMTGSGGLLLLDSELGCRRFRPGPGYLKGREENA